MIRKYFLCLFLVYFGITLDAQVLSYPTFKSRSNHSMTISKIKRGKHNVQFEMKHYAPEEYENGGWIYISGTCKLIDKKNNLTYKLIGVEGIDTVETKKHNYNKTGDSLIFTLTFEPIKKETEVVDFIECQTKNCFNFYDLKLRKNEPMTFESDSVREYLPNVTYNMDKTSPGKNVFKFANNNFYGFTMSKADGNMEVFTPISKIYHATAYNGLSAMQYTVKGDKGNQFDFQMVGDDLIIFFYLDKTFEFKRSK